MGQRRQGINRLAVQQDVQLDKPRRAERVDVVVERGIALRYRLQLVVEVNDNLAKRQHEVQLHTIAADILLVYQFAALVETECHNRSDKVGGRDDTGTYIGLLNMVYHRLVGQSRGVVHLLHLALLGVADVRHVGNRCDDVHIELSVQALLYNLHVEQSQETATETESQRYRRLGRERQRRVVQLQLLKRCTQVLILRRVYGIDASKHHRLHLLESLDGGGAGVLDVGDGVAHLHLFRVLDAADDVAHVARLELLAGYHVHLQYANLVGVVFHTGVEELHEVTLADAAVHNLEVSDDAAEGVEHGVEDQRLQLCVRVADGVGDTVYDGVKDFAHAFARLAAGANDVAGVAAYEVDNLVLHLVGHSRRHVNLVDDGNNLQVMVDGHIEVRDGLCLHALSGIDDEQRPLAGSNAARHFV